MSANVYVYDGLGLEAHLCPTLQNEIKKTKLQIYAEPQAGINILLAAVLLFTPLFLRPEVYSFLLNVSYATKH